MTKFIEYILTLFGNFSPVKQIFLIIIVGSITFLGYNFVKNESFRKSVIKIFTASFRTLKNRNISLLNHELFYMQSFYNQLISNIKFTSNVKTDLFRILLTEKTKAVISITKDWIKTLDYKEITDCELFDKMTCCVVEIIATYERNIRTGYKEILPITYIDAYKLVYESEKGFKAFHADNVNYIQRNIQKIAFTNMFSIKQKIWSFINQLEFATEIALTDCEASFNALNGNIEKLLNKN